MAKRKKKFPDLTKDGKVTQADILKGRGVIENNDFISEVMRRVEESELLIEQEADTIIEECNTIQRILGIDFLSLNESVDNSLINLLEEDNLDEAEFLGGLCEVFDMDPDDVSDEQINEIAGFLKNRRRAKRRGKLVGRFTKGLEGKENAKARAKRRLQGHRIANENPEGTMAGRRASRNPKGGKIVTKQIGNTTARRNTASVFNAKSGKNNPDRFAKAKATKDNPLDSEGRQKDIYAAIRQKAQAAKRKRLGLPPAAKKADTKRMKKAPAAAAAAESADIVRGARLALAERVLDSMIERDNEVREAVFKYLEENWDKNLDEGLKQKLMAGALAAGMACGAGGCTTTPKAESPNTTAIERAVKSSEYGYKGRGGRTFLTKAQRSKDASDAEKREVSREKRQVNREKAAEEGVMRRTAKNLADMKDLDKKLYKKK